MLGQRDHRISHSHDRCSLHAVPSRQEQYATSGEGDCASRFCAALHQGTRRPHSFGVDNFFGAVVLSHPETGVARGSSATSFAPVPPVAARSSQACRPMIGNRQVQFVALCNGVRVSCVLCTADHLRGRGQAAGKLCGRQPIQAKLLKNNAQNLSAPSPASTASASVLLNWPAWPSRKRLMQTSPSSRASTFARRVDGLPTTPSRRQTSSASCSLKS